MDSFDQFWPMVLASDFSWSTRYDKLSNLGYDAATVFRRMYFEEARPIFARQGMEFADGTEIKQVAFRDVQVWLGNPIRLRSLLSSPNAPASVSIPMAQSGGHIALAMGAADRCDEGELLARIRIETTDGKEAITKELRYGHQLRQVGDERAIPLCESVDGLSCIQLDLPKRAKIARVVVESLNPRGGIAIHGFSVW